MRAGRASPAAFPFPLGAHGAGREQRMTNGCFIGIDQGSSSTKAIALDRNGARIAEARRDLPPPLREGPRVEQGAEAVLDSVRQAVADVTLRAAASGCPVLGIGLSCQRSSCLAWDRATGKPLSPVLSWRDLRGSATVDRLASRAAEIFERTGLPLTPYYAASKLQWLREHLRPPGDAVLGTLSSFLCQRLTGSSSPVIDHTSAARTQLMDIRTLAWAPGLLGLFGLDKAALPEIVPTVHPFGNVDTPSGPAPLVASIGDQQAAMLGLGVLAPGLGGINYGTGGFLMVHTGRELRPVPRLMASVLYSSASETQYLVEGSVNAAGDALAWLRTNFGLFREFDELDGLCRSAKTDVVAFLGLNGTGAPHWEEEIGSVIDGLGAESASADIVRAVAEGIAFFMTDIASALAAGGTAPSTVTVSGGLSSFAYLVAAQAALLGLPLSVTSAPETSALGAAFLAGIGTGAWTPADCVRIAPPAAPVEPLNDARLRLRYERWQELHAAARRRKATF